MLSFEKPQAAHKTETVLFFVGKKQGVGRGHAVRRRPSIAVRRTRSSCFARLRRAYCPRPSTAGRGKEGIIKAGRGRRKKKGKGGRRRGSAVACFSSRTSAIFLPPFYILQAPCCVTSLLIRREKIGGGGGKGKKGDPRRMRVLDAGAAPSIPFLSTAISIRCFRRVGTPTKRQPSRLIGKKGKRRERKQKKGERPRVHVPGLYYDNLSPDLFT